MATICTHFIFFHEASFQFRTERMQGRRWIADDGALQPHDVRCTFNQDADPPAFGATPQTGTGFFKLSCDHMSIRTHCIDVVHGDPTPSNRDARNGARGVRDIKVRFTYDGQEQTLRRSG